MNRWSAVVFLVLWVLVGAMGMRNLVIHHQVAVNGAPHVAVTGLPVPPPW